MGSLEVLAARDNGLPYPDASIEWERIWYKSGNQGVSWRSASIPVSDRFGEFVKFRFVATTGNGFRSDIAIDKIHVQRVNTSTTVISQNTTYQEPHWTCGDLRVNSNRTLTVERQLSIDKGDELQFNSNAVVELGSGAIIKFDYPFKVSY